MTRRRLALPGGGAAAPRGRGETRSDAPASEAGGLWDGPLGIQPRQGWAAPESSGCPWGFDSLGRTSTQPTPPQEEPPIPRNLIDPESTGDNEPSF